MRNDHLSKVELRAEIVTADAVAVFDPDLVGYEKVRCSSSGGALAAVFKLLVLKTAAAAYQVTPTPRRYGR